MVGREGKKKTKHGGALLVYLFPFFFIYYTMQFAPAHVQGLRLDNMHLLGRST